MSEVVYRPEPLPGPWDGAAGETDPDKVRRYIAEWLVGYSSPATRSGYRGELSVWLDFCAVSGLDPLAVRRAHLDAWVRGLEAQGVAPATVRRRMAAVSSFYRWCSAQEHIVRNPAVLLRRPPVQRNPLRRSGLTEGEAVALVTAADTSTHDHAPREQFLLRLMLSNGLRIGSIVAANLGDLGMDMGNYGLRFYAKGGRVYFAPFNPPTAHACREYLTYRAGLGGGGAVALRGQAGGTGLAAALFFKYDGERITKGSVTKALRRLAAEAGLDCAEDISPHWLRRTFATASLNAGVTLRRLQDALGHASPETTRLYDLDRNNVLHHPAHRLTHLVGDHTPTGTL